jgi:prepilin-type N-terminal cleavage/methylation domain-containing protein
MIRNARGFTLNELLVTTAIMGVIMLALASLISLLNFSYLSKSDELAAESAAAKAEFLLRNVFSQAVYIQYTNPPSTPPTSPLATGVNINPGGPTPAPGLIADENFTTISAGAMAANPNYDIIAVFLREIQTMDPPGVAPTAALATSLLQRTMITFQRPQTQAASGRQGGTAGILWFTNGIPRPAPVPPLPVGGAVAMKPTYSPAAAYDSDYVDRVSFFTLTQSRANPTYDAVTSVDIHLRFRWHTKTSPGTTWCPANDLAVASPNFAACEPVANRPMLWHDVDKQFTVLLRNNMIRTATNVSREATGGAFEEHTLGNLYFFSPVVPTLKRGQ